jgi:hypothetical protein
MVNYYSSKHYTIRGDEMKYIFLVLMISGICLAQLPGWYEGGPATLWSMTAVEKAKVVVDAAPSQLQHVVGYPASSVFATDTLGGVLDNANWIIYDSKGDITADTTGKSPCLAITILEIWQDNDSLTLSIPFALMDSAMADSDEVSFVVAVKESQDGNPGFATETSTLIEYVHDSYTPVTAGQRLTASGVIATPAEGSIVLVSIIRDNRDTYAGSVAVPYFELSYWAEPVAPVVAPPPSPK